jgi:hypothetical protein
MAVSPLPLGIKHNDISSGEIQFMSAGVHSQVSGAFNNFLYSPVGDEADHMPVSVLSALARRDIDPWDEAAQLARMPKSVAIARLTSMISTPGLDLSAQSRAELVATRLIELLPKPPLLGIPGNTAISLPRLPGNYWKIIACLAVGIAFLLLMIFGG